jgi:hypothetical protein
LKAQSLRFQTTLSDAVTVAVVVVLVVVAAVTVTIVAMVVAALGGPLMRARPTTMITAADARRLTEGRAKAA